MSDDEIVEFTDQNQPKRKRARPGRYPKGSPEDLYFADLRARFIERLRAGQPYRQAAADLNVKPSTAYTWTQIALRKGLLEGSLAGAATLGLPKKMMTPEERARKKDAAHELFKANHTAAYVAETVGVSYSTIQTWKKEWRETHRRRGTEKPKSANDPIAWDDLTDVARHYLTPEGFSEFRTDVLGHFTAPWSVEDAITLLELYESDEDEYAVVNEPPGIGKSTLITHDFAVWVAMRERAMGRQLTCALGHKSEDKAMWYVDRLMRTFELNATLVQLYGRCRPDRKGARWSKKELDVEPLDWSKLDYKEPTFSSQSYEKSLLSGRFTLSIWDDLVDRTNSTTVEQRDRMQSWWEQDAETRMEPGGLIVLSNARYGPEDLSWYVRQDTDAEDLDDSGVERPIYVHLRHPAHDTSKCPKPDAEGHVNHHGNQPDGCLLDERRVSWKRVRKAMKNSTRFALVMQQEDVDPKGALAQSAWFDGGYDLRGAMVPGCFDERLHFGQLRKANEGPIVSAVTVDPSGSRYWGAMHLLGWADRTTQVYRGLRGPMQAPELLYRQEDGSFTGLLHDWHEASKAEGRTFTYLIVEGRATQRWLMQYEFFRTWCSHRGITIIPHDTGMNKLDPDAGVEMTGPIFEHGRLRIPYAGTAEREFGDALKREACSYPEGATSDLLMAFWFYAHRMEQLTIAAIQDDNDGYDEDTPPWAQRAMGGSRVPAFAKKRMRDLTGARG